MLKKTVMKTVSYARFGHPVGSWCWLFPVTYLVHIAEEYWGGEGFPAWLSRMTNIRLGPAEFLLMNGLAWLLMIVGILLVLQSRAMHWLLASFGTVVLLNGVLHLIGSLITNSYSPGLVSGIALWVPLGLFTLFRLRRRLTNRSFRAGVLVGVAMHGVVSVLALFSQKLFGA